MSRLRTAPAYSRGGTDGNLVFRRRGPLARGIAVVGMVALLVSYAAPTAEAFLAQTEASLPPLASPELSFPSFGGGEDGASEPGRRGDGKVESADRDEQQDAPGATEGDAPEAPRDAADPPSGSRGPPVARRGRGMRPSRPPRPAGNRG